MTLIVVLFAIVLFMHCQPYYAYHDSTPGSVIIDEAASIVQEVMEIVSGGLPSA